MTKYASARTASVLAQGSFARVLAGPFGKHIALEAPNEGGSGGSGDDEAAKAAAAAAAAEKTAKEAAEKEAAEKAAKDKLNDADAKLLKENMERKANEKKLKEQLDALAPLKAAIDGLGGLEKLQALAQAQKTAEEEKLAKAGEFDTLKKMIVEENQAKVAAAEAKVAEKETALEAANRTIDELTIGAAFNATPVISELVLTPSKTRQIYGAHFDREDGVIVAYDKPKGTAGRVKMVDGNGEPLSFDAALKKLVEADPDREKLVKSKLINGTGSRTTDDKPTDKTSDVRGLARMQAILAKRQTAK